MEVNTYESKDIWNTVNSLENDQSLINFKSSITKLDPMINDKEKLKNKSKCIAMTLDFNGTPQDLDTIVFKNYFTYTISVLVMKIADTNANRLKKWYIAIKKKVIIEK